MNPKGLFVSTDFKKAMYFAYDTDTMVIMEFTVKSDDLDTPVWNDSFGYFGQCSNPQPFSSREEREKQKQAYQDSAKNSNDEYVRNSDNPAMAERIFNNGVFVLIELFTQLLSTEQKPTFNLFAIALVKSSISCIGKDHKSSPNTCSYCSTSSSFLSTKSTNVTFFLPIVNNCFIYLYVFKKFC